MDVQFNEHESSFSKDVDMVPLQGEINSKEKETVWLEEKRWWISSKGEDLELDDSRSRSLNAKKQHKYQTNCFNNIIQERRKIPLAYPLQVWMLISMILPCHWTTLLELILRYKILHL